MHGFEGEKIRCIWVAVHTILSRFQYKSGSIWYTYVLFDMESNERGLLGIGGGMGSSERNSTVVAYEFNF